MSDRDKLLAAILVKPDEDTPRLMLADWLEEYGSGDRDAATVEFIRISCDMTNRPTMPKPAYAWIEAHWMRLVPSVLALAVPPNPKTVARRNGRVIHLGLRIAYPASRAKSGTRMCPMLLDFHKGLLRKAVIHSAYTAGASLDAFAADQPQALLDCPGLIQDGTFARIVGDEKIRTGVRKMYVSLSAPKVPQPAMPGVE